MVRVVGRGEFRELAVRPVERAAVHDHAAHLERVPVHVLGRRMHHDVRPEFDGPAQHRRGEGVVHNQRHAVLVRDAGELLDVQDVDARIGDGFAEQGLCVGTEGRLNVILGGLGVHEGHFDAELPEGHGEQVERTAVDGGGADEGIARRGEGQDGKHGRGLTGGRAQGPYPAFQHGDLLLHGVHGRVGDAGVEETGFLKVEQLADLLGGFVFERRALTDGQRLRFAVFGGIAGVQALRFDFHDISPFRTVSPDRIRRTFPPCRRPVSGKKGMP